MGIVVCDCLRIPLSKPHGQPPGGGFENLPSLLPMGRFGSKPT